MCKREGKTTDNDIASTIGSNPWNDRTKKQRRVVGSLTTTPAIKRLTGMLDLETWQMVQAIFEASQGGKAISPHIYQKRLALNVVLMFCYERRFEDIADPLMSGILADAKVISRHVYSRQALRNSIANLNCSFRSTNSNAQDYIPYLRFGFLQDKNRAAMATEVRCRRDKWLTALLQEVKESIAAEKVKSCVASGLLTDTQENLTRREVP